MYKLFVHFNILKKFFKIKFFYSHPKDSDQIWVRLKQPGINKNYDA